MPDDPGIAGAPGTSGVRLVIPAEPMAVRQALLDLFAMAPTDHLPDDLRSTAEIVIAEVLNNIVEHAYAGTKGDIDLSIRPTCDGLWCTVIDHGAPMPGNALPVAVLPNSLAEDLPEGGFGWYLIRTLARDVRYDRKGPTNCLTFWLPATDGGIANADISGAATCP